MILKYKNENEISHFFQLYAVLYFDKFFSDVICIISTASQLSHQF